MKTKKQPRIKTPESGVLRACLDLLAAEKIWHRRWNTGAVKAGDRFFRFGQAGDADILMTFRKTLVFFQGHPHETIVNTIILTWVECKSDSGKQSDDQVRFEFEVGKQGHYYLLVRSVDDLKAWLKSAGVIQ